jgi:hypothetical protein
MPLGPYVKFLFLLRFSISQLGLDKRIMWLKPRIILELRRGFSEDFLVARWRRFNHPPYPV